MNRWSRWLAGIVALLVLVMTGIAQAFTVPSPEGAVTDTSGMLDAEDDRILEEGIAAYRERTGHEIGVLVIPSLEGETIEDVTYRTFNAWGVGKRGADDGVLLVIAMKEHRTRIETGKGIGHLLTDVQSARILQDTLAPRLRRSQYRDGIAATLEAIEAALDGQVEPARTPPPPERESRLLFVGLLVGLIGLGFVVAAAGSRRRRRSGSGGGSYDSSYSSFSSSSSDGGGSSSGGGGDFGGGSSGGGGASGGW
jgi:uncharacterized protein